MTSKRRQANGILIDTLLHDKLYTCSSGQLIISFRVRSECFGTISVRIVAKISDRIDYEITLMLLNLIVFYIPGVNCTVWFENISSRLWTCENEV